MIHKKWVWCLMMLVGLAAVGGGVARGQETAAQEAAPKTTAPKPTPKVKAVFGEIQLGNTVLIEVDNLEDWATGNDATRLVPYLNGIGLAGTYPESIHTTHNKIYFHLEQNQGSREAWSDLLRDPDFQRPVAITVGLENQSPFDTAFDHNNMLPLTIIPARWGILSLVVISLCLILFLWLAKTTNIIREPGPPPDNGRKRPYSLGRAQMAFWFFLIFISYLTIWLIVGDLDTITESLLGLMGISAGTALGGAIIDTSKLNAKKTQLQDLTTQKNTLSARLAEITPQLSDIDARAGADPPTATAADLTNRSALAAELQDKQGQLDQVNQQIAALSSSMDRTSSVNFLCDVLSDKDGYSFHRFQIFAWTIALGIIFVASVYNTLTMPNFSTTLLGLMGISAGTYIGFKFPEQ